MDQDCYSNNKSWLDKAYNLYSRCDVENVAIGGLGAKDATALESINKTDRTPSIPNPKRIPTAFLNSSFLRRCSESD